MNRLVLIGNGFDLAHGKKTGYIDFIKWYMLKCIKLGIGEESEIEPLITLKLNKDYPNKSLTDDILMAWINDWINSNHTLDRFGEAVRGWSGNIAYPFIMKAESTLLASLLTSCANYGWVDIEAAFYESLTSILVNQKTVHEQESKLKKLNKAMFIISSELEEYLRLFQNTTKLNPYQRVIYAPFVHDDLQSIPGNPLKIGGGKYISTNNPREVVLLNFNYTDTCESYATPPIFKPAMVINIHGRLDDDMNPIIFGFGDEVDKRYEEIENSRSKGWFEYIKSFGYLKTNNYRQLTSFIDSEQYQIIILGHSCGLSDRTMLQMIFQHDNCRSIKLYYYGDKEKNNFKQTLHEVARHFKDKGLMRRRIVSEENSERMPQFDD